MLLIEMNQCDKNLCAEKQSKAIAEKMTGIIADALFEGDASSSQNRGETKKQ